MLRRTNRRSWLTLTLCVAPVLASTGCRPGQTPWSRLADPGPTDAAERAEAGEDYLRQARDYVNRGKLEAAMAATERAIAANPGLVNAHLTVGDLHRWRGEYELAAEEYERAATIDPASFAANEDLADVYSRLGRAADAEPYARKATRLNPRSAGSWVNLATSCRILRRYADAIDAYHRASRLGELAELDRLGLADAHNKLGQYGGAVAVLKPLVEHAARAAAYEHLGYAQFKRKQYDDATASFRLALLHDPNLPAALNGLGICLMTRQLQAGTTSPDVVDEAMALWRRSIQLDPYQPGIVSLTERFGATSASDGDQ